MDLQEFKKKTIKDIFNIDNSFGKILPFIDFANVNHWFDDDQYDLDGKALSTNQSIEIDISKLKDFLNCFVGDAEPNKILYCANKAKVRLVKAGLSQIVNPYPRAGINTITKIKLKINTACG